MYKNWQGNLLSQIFCWCTSTPIFLFQNWSFLSSSMVHCTKFSSYFARICSPCQPHMLHNQLASIMYECRYICVDTVLRPTVVCCAVKKVTRNTRVLFTRTKISPISTSCILKTTEQISTKFTYFMLYIYLTLHTKFNVDCTSGSWDICFWKLPDFLRMFSSFSHQNKNIFKIRENHLLLLRFLSNLEQN